MLHSRSRNMMLATRNIVCDIEHTWAQSTIAARVQLFVEHAQAPS
jgi:hypothetical protein